MRIAGHGVDIVETGRVAGLIDRRREDLLDGWLTAEEQRRIPESDEARFLAGRIAAKEAVAKSLGTGFSGDVSWTDIEIRQTETGQPSVTVTNGAKETAERLGVTGWHLSISHSAEYSVASAIAVCE